MMIRMGASDRTRWRLLVAAAVLVLLQVATVSHLVGDSAAGDSAGCAICLAANGSSGAATPAAISLPVFSSTVSLVVESVARPLCVRIVASYRARAPPVSV